MLVRVQQSLIASNNNFPATLQRFASKGDVEAIESIIENHPEVDIDVHSSKKRNTSLHAALIQNQQGFVIDFLIKKGANINAFNKKGLNPVILAIVHCRPGTQALEKLIRAGAALDRFERGRFIGLNVLDIAMHWKNEEAVTFLEGSSLALGASEKKGMRDGVKKVNIVVGCKEKGKGICPLCNCRVKFPTNMSFLKFNQERAEKGYNDNLLKTRQFDKTNPCSVSTSAEHANEINTVYISHKYLDEFMSHAKGESYRKLCGIEYHGVSNMHKLRKELSESYSILHAVQECWLKSKERNQVKVTLDDKDPVSFEDIYLIDLCSGKSLTAALCAVLFPAHSNNHNNNHVLAVDKLPSQKVPHFMQDANINYLTRDIMSPEFLKELEEEVHHQSQVEGRTVILVGMHLCGNLSERAIEFFHKISLIEAIIISPCCLPRLNGRKDPSGNNSLENVETYMDWSHHLKYSIYDAKNEVNLYTDHEMHSTKNSIITATRSAL